MCAVMDELHCFAEWRVLGRNLGIHEGQLDVFERDAGDTHGRLSKVIDCWLRRNHNEEKCGLPTWGNLAKAVKPIDNALAMEIETKHGVCRGKKCNFPHISNIVLLAVTHSRTGRLLIL